MRAAIGDTQYETRLHAVNWWRGARTVLLLCLVAAGILYLPRWAMLLMLAGSAAGALWVRLVISVADETLDSLPDDI